MDQDFPDTMKTKAKCKNQLDIDASKRAAVIQTQ